MTTQAPATEARTTSPKPRIRVTGHGRYLVESRTRPGIGYPVDVAQQTCRCQAAKHGRRCWHLTWANQYHQWRMEQEQAAQAAAVPAPAAPQAPEGTDVTGLNERLAELQGFLPARAVEAAKRLREQMRAAAVPVVPASVRQTGELRELSSYFE